MNTINLTDKDYKILDIKEYKKKFATEKDSTRLINEDTLVNYNGQPIILYKKIKENTEDVHWAVRSMKYAKSNRTSYMKQLGKSKLFGFMPRRVLRQDYCNTVTTARDYPKQHSIITNFGKTLTNYYQEYFPHILKEHYKVVKEKVKKDWTITDTPFTSGIINQNNQLRYHTDKGNFKGVLSNMLCFKNGITGGRLVCPEYNLKFEIDNDYLLIFDGQQIIHGVTPIIKTHAKGYRYTIVYYTLEQMWKCETVDDELLRIRELKKQREHKRL